MHGHCNSALSHQVWTARQKSEVCLTAAAVLGPVYPGKYLKYMSRLMSGCVLILKKLNFINKVCISCLCELLFSQFYSVELLFQLTGESVILGTVK